jgi:serine/threonine protein kinase/Tol biopolymer transport system component
MSSDRWRQVEDLCHAALAYRAEERRPFLVQACEGDEVLLREVESLLAQESRAEAFMSVPAAALAGSTGFEQPRAAVVGRRFGSYTIRSLLGVGGMGEVYRAYDETLGREVAIKLLSPAFTAEPDRRARFEREARMLATLNHPHIGAIYGVEETDGVRGLVLELVEGATLAERIAASARTAGSNPPGLPMTEALTIARQIVDALEAAHEKGIVHRDLKPANIKITPDGVAKVLDFGLAKVASPDSSSSDLGQSRAGAIFGTAAYMSPEQARGHNVDKRADIWAFGCVLFEMLTGRAAFAGETASDTIARILEREPDWSVLPAATPARIRQLLVRCLAKDPKQRLRDIGDVRIEMDSADDALPRVSDETMASSARTKTGTTALPWVALAALFAGVAVREVRRPPIVQESPLANAQFSRFTNWEGTEAGAEISPDGKFVAFKADHDGEVDLWVKQVGTGDFLNLTQNIPPMSLPGIIRTFGFNGDGSEIWFAEGSDSSAPKWLVPVTGGPRRPLLGKGDAAPSWSPDDTRLIYFTNGGGDPFSIADRASANARPLLVDTPGFFAKGVHNHNPVWSPDDRWIYFAHGPDADEEMNVWRVRPSGGTPEQLTALRAAANHLAVIDQHTVLYVASAEDGSGPWLWSLDVETKATRRVISGVEHYSSVSASRDGRHIVATVSNTTPPTASLWRVPLLLDRQAEDRDVQPYGLPSAPAFSPRFGGQSLFYLSGPGTGDGLWRVQDGNSSEVWKAANDSLSEPPAASPDGTRVAIIIRQEGKLRLLMMSADGTNARTLAPSITIQSSEGHHGSADWSPDGVSIVAAGTDEQGPGLFLIPVDGRAPRRLVSGQVVNPVWSPHGDLIVYGGPMVGGRVPLLGVKPDSTRVELPDVRTGRGGGHRFLPNGTGLVYVPDHSRDFWLLDLATNKTHLLAHLSDHGAVSAFDITPDSKEIVFDRLRDNSDIVLIDLPK